MSVPHTADLFTPDLFAPTPDAPRPIAPGAVLLPGAALGEAPALLAAIRDVLARAPWRQMLTPGGFRMSVAMSNCGALGWVSDRRLTVGAVRAALPAMPAGFEAAHSRNNQLLLAAALQIEPELRAAITRYGATRVGLVLGTSTSGIREASDGIARFLKEGELPADYDYAQQEMAAEAGIRAGRVDDIANFLNQWGNE